MKTLKTFALLTIFMFLLSATSCVVVPRHHDNGNHKGWFKNSNNPHHYKSTKRYKKYEIKSKKRKGLKIEISASYLLHENVYPSGDQQVS
jgi:hypothetical protein